MKTIERNKKIPSVNYHLWEPCNMRCKFCFATFQDVKIQLPKGHLPKEESLKLVKEIANFGFQKITFAGGEPTLCPWISELIKLAKENGLTTMIVTNGSQLSEEFLIQNQNNLDWIILSVDSIREETNIESGRAITGKKPLLEEDYKMIIDRIKKYGFQLKINTVVHRQNYRESLMDLLRYAQPQRWKIFQVLPIKGENDAHINDFIIDESEFEHFITKHQPLKDEKLMITENNCEMKDSYVMIDPAGKFYTNKNGIQEYSDPILQSGIKDSYQQMNYNYEKFVARGGIYKW